MAVSEPMTLMAKEDTPTEGAADQDSLLPNFESGVRTSALPASRSSRSSVLRTQNLSNWPTCLGLMLVLLILSGYIAAISLYSHGANGVDREVFSAEGLVLGAVHADNLVPKWEDLPKMRVVDYGAVHDDSGDGDAVLTNTRAFQSAIQAATDAGGGFVVVDKGRYAIGTIDLLSNSYLYLQEDAVVLGSHHERHYPYPDAWESDGAADEPLEEKPILIRCKNQNRVGIMGNGVIDGDAVPYFVDGYRRDWDKLLPRKFRKDSCVGECRPQLVLMERCHEIVVQNVTLQNSPDWTLHVRGCSEVLLENLQIQGDFRWPNNDGIDIDSTIDVTIRNNTIVTADDGICIKTTARYGPTMNILIQNNVIKSRSSAFKIGSATEEDIFNVFVDQLYILSGTNRGLGIQHRDEGNVYNIHFRHVVVGGTTFQTEGWWGSAEPIYISTLPRHADGVIGGVANITIQDFKAYDVANGVFLSSVRGGRPLLNVSFVNAHVLLVQYPKTWDFDNGRLSPQNIPGVNYSEPQLDYRPTDLEPALVSVNGKVDAVFLEGVDIASAICRGSSVTFVKGVGSDSGQDWWGDCLGGQKLDKTGAFRGLKCVFGGSPF